MTRSERCGRGFRCGDVMLAALVYLVAFGWVTQPAVAQAAKDIAGTWQGTLQANKSQRIMVKVQPDGAGWKGVVYNLDGNIAWEGRATTQMILAGAGLRFAIASIEVNYEGQLGTDGVSIAGTWTQSGQAHPLVLARVTGGAEWEIPEARVQMAKEADPDWEVATVKPSDPNDTNSRIQRVGRRVVIECRTVKSMLIFGYGMHEKQLAALPDWVESERWDVDGVPDVQGRPNLPQMQSLVRKILAERFGLRTHLEKREMSVYAITVAKGGPKVMRSTDQNGQMNENDRGVSGQRTLWLTNASLAEFALMMKSMFSDRPVVDQTGLPGKYDITLKWTFDEAQAPTDGSAAPSLFTAVQEQLGLKLDAVKSQTDVLVVDEVERPGAN